MNLEHRCFLIAASTILLFTLIPQSTDARVWTSTEGEKLEAIFEKLDGDKIQLRLKNGRSVIFPLSRLVKEDHEAAERFKLVGDDAMTVYSAKKIDYLLARNLGRQASVPTMTVFPTTSSSVVYTSISLGVSRLGRSS